MNEAVTLDRLTMVKWLLAIVNRSYVWRLAIVDFGYSWLWLSPLIVGKRFRPHGSRWCHTCPWKACWFTFGAVRHGKQLGHASAGLKVCNKTLRDWVYRITTILLPATLRTMTTKLQSPEVDSKNWHESIDPGTAAVGPFAHLVAEARHAGPC